jgi:hypothetical protein
VSSCHGGVPNRYAPQGPLFSDHNRDPEQQPGSLLTSRDGSVLTSVEGCRVPKSERTKRVTPSAPSQLRSPAPKSDARRPQSFTLARPHRRAHHRGLPSDRSIREARSNRGVGASCASPRSIQGIRRPHRIAARPTIVISSSLCIVACRLRLVLPPGARRFVARLRITPGFT